MRVKRTVLIATMLLAGCGGGGGGQADADAWDEGVDTAADPGDATDAPDTTADAFPDGDADTAGDVPADVPVEPGVDECTEGERLCTGHASRRICADTADGTRWQDEACAAGWGCVAGECVEGDCSDECNLGETDGGLECGLLDMATGAWATIDPAGSMLDRARDYNRWIRRDGMSHGGVGDAYYSDPPAYTSVMALGGTGDSAIWTGTYLAAESLRLMETGSSDARENVKSLVETLHLWFNVSGDPGLLARYAAPAGDHPLVAMDCSESRIHCAVDYEGTSYDYSGHISRDQYQGVMLGYALAYEALGGHDEGHRAIIREDVVELVNELMTERTVPVLLTYNGTDLPRFNVTMRFVVLATAEMDGGAVHIAIDTANPDDSEMTGFQEFIPHYEDVLRQFPVIGGLVPAIPRAGSGVMLASFFRVGMLVTEGVPWYEDELAAFESFYYTNAGWGGNVGDWMDAAELWSYYDDCGDAYYANNIDMEPMYNLARLEDDLDTAGRVVGNVLEDRMWPGLSFTKNPWFSYIYAASVPWHDASVISGALDQLSQFPPPPRVHVAVNLLADPAYSELEPGCTNQLVHTQAVDVGDRAVSDFIWQRHPWLLLDGGDPARTYPGVDYMAAYWLGRFHGFIDGEPGECLAWH